MIPYIGDISKNDSIVLSELAAQSKNILEFGVGASTQVIAAFAKGKFTSIDTSIEWIDKTKKNLHLLEINLPINFCLYKDFLPSHDKYDFIFNDGLDSLRRELDRKSTRLNSSH